jgi:hypothetical protein
MIAKIELKQENTKDFTKNTLIMSPKTARNLAHELLMKLKIINQVV